MLGVERVYMQSASHRALVSDAVFDKVQYMLNKKKVSVHYEQKLNAPYRGLVRCSLCGRVYAIFTKKALLTWVRVAARTTGKYSEEF